MDGLLLDTERLELEAGPAVLAMNSGATFSIR